MDWIPVTNATLESCGSLAQSNSCTLRQDEVSLCMNMCVCVCVCVCVHGCVMQHAYRMNAVLISMKSLISSIKSSWNQLNSSD